MSLPLPVHAAADEGLWSARRRSLTGGLVLTITLVAFEALAVATVMPDVARELGGLSNGLYGWAFTAFFLGSLVGIVVVGGAVDGRGLARPFMLGLGLFAIGLVLGGAAPTMEILIVGRFLQGLGAGAIPPIAYVAIGRSLPERLRPRMFAPDVDRVGPARRRWAPPWQGSSARPSAGGRCSCSCCRSSGSRPCSRCRAVRAVATPPDAVAAEATALASLRRRLPLAIVVAVRRVSSPVH